MKRVWPWLWVTLAVILVVRTGVRDRGVIHDHMEFGRRVVVGADLYAPYLEDKPLHAPYPPGFGLLTAPFSVLPPRAARVAWALLQLLALAALGLWARDALAAIAPDQLPRLQLLLLLTAALAARYVLRDTHGGGGNLINLAFAVTSVGLAERGRGVTAGLLLGFSLATKPTHVLFLPLLWLLGHRRAASVGAGAAVAFTGTALVLLGAGTAPLERWFEGTWAYARAMDVFAEPALGFPRFTWMNQCLRCATARYLGEVPAAHAAIIPGFFPGLGLSATAVAWVTRGLVAAALTTTALMIWRRPRSAPWLVALACCLSLLLSPISWKGHHVALIPAFFLLLARGFAGQRWLLAVLAAYAVACLAGEDLTGKAFKELQQSLYVFTAGTLVLWGICLIAARDHRRSQDPPSDTAIP